MLRLQEDLLDYGMLVGLPMRVVWNDGNLLFKNLMELLIVSVFNVLVIVNVSVEMETYVCI